MSGAFIQLARLKKKVVELEEENKVLTDTVRNQRREIERLTDEISRVIITAQKAKE